MPRHQGKLPTSAALKKHDAQLAGPKAPGQERVLNAAEFQSVKGKMANQLPKMQVKGTLTGKGAATFRKPSFPYGKMHERPIFPHDRNQNVQCPMRWSSAFINRTNAAYNKEHFQDLVGDGQGQFAGGRASGGATGLRRNPHVDFVPQEDLHQ